MALEHDHSSDIWCSADCVLGGVPTYSYLRNFIWSFSAMGAKRWDNSPALRDSPWTLGEIVITIATFSKPEEAHLLRMRLEAGGIPAFVQDENLVQMDWLYSNAIGGVRVQIAEEDIPKAKELLEQESVALEEAVAVQCPFCDSANTGIDELPRRISFLSLLLLNFPFLFAKNRYKCSDCGKIWNERKRPSSCGS